jgi:predicted permease
MGIGAWVGSLWRNLFARGRVEAGLNAELREYVELLTDEKVAAGLSRAEARRLALVELGGEMQVKQAVRERRAGAGFEALWQDVRFAFRTLKKDRSFTLVAVLILGLGIGANVAVFSVVNTMLLRPLPFRDPQQLVWMEGNNGLGSPSDVTYRVDAFQEFQRNNRSFETVTAFVPYYNLSETRLKGDGELKPIEGVWVAGDFFETLGVHPMLGRSFTGEEAVNYNKGGRPAVILSYRFWQRQFNADPAIVGKLITINNRATPVVGVLGPDFDFGTVFAPGTKMDYFVPIIMDSISGWGHMLALVGKLKPGVTLQQAQAESNVLFPKMKAAGHPEWDTDYKTVMTGLKEHVSGAMRRPLEILWCAVGMILLIVCVNLSNLLLVRMAARSKEFALRISLGAGRGRLARQLLTESLVLSGMGATLGLGMAYAATRFLVQQGSLMGSGALPLLSGCRVDGAALGWTVLIAAMVGLVFGLAPGIQVSSGNVQELLKDGGHTASGGKRHEGLRSALVVSEIALACLLLVGAGLLLRSFMRVMDTDLGFNPSHAAALTVDYDDKGNTDKRGEVLSEMVRSVSAVPGVESAAVTDLLPLVHGRSWDLIAKNKPHVVGADTDAFIYVVTPGYLRTMGMRLRAGRDLDWRDTANKEHVIVINEAAARREWPGQDPIGKLAGGIGDGDSRVVGVIADVHESSVEAPSSPEVYAPIMQAQPNQTQLVVRSRLPLGAIAPGVMSALRTMNPNQPATEFRPLQTIVDRATAPRRFLAVLVGIFAALGLVLASLGIYGVISYSVAQRTQEIGIRMALGASAGQVQRGVMTKTLRLALVGMAVGSAASFVGAKAIVALLFETAPTDLATYAEVLGLLGVVAVVAGYLPARRASRTSPMVALRGE